MRAVVDVNVLVSALLSPSGNSTQIFSRWLAGEFELVVSPKLLTELRRALRYPKVRRRIPTADAAEFTELLRQTAVLGVDPPDPPPRSPDSGDDYLLALAESNKAVLVSGDRDLLELADRFPVLTPAAFLDSLSEDAPV